MSAKAILGLILIAVCLVLTAVPASADVDPLRTQIREIKREIAPYLVELSELHARSLGTDPGVLASIEFKLLDPKTDPSLADVQIVRISLDPPVFAVGCESDTSNSSCQGLCPCE